MSNVRICFPDAYHGIGIEFNYNREHENSPSGAFVRAAREATSGSRLWFHKSGAGNDRGYQFFEYFGTSTEIVKRKAHEIADALGVTVETG